MDATSSDTAAKAAKPVEPTAGRAEPTMTFPTNFLPSGPSPLGKPDVVPPAEFDAPYAVG